MEKEMKFGNWILAALAIVLCSAPAFAHTLVICKGEYALCAASATTPTGRTIKVGTRTFREGVAVCPILKGDAVADLDLMNGSCVAQPGKVWSLFGVPAVKEYPQAPSWAPAPAQFRSFTIGTTPSTGMSNMWSYPCDIQAQPVNGTRLASCYGPIMESPWAHRHVKPGEKGFTQAATGASYPVGGNVPQGIAPEGN